MMDLEILFKFVVLFAQLCALLTVAAFVADHIVQPILDRRKRGIR